MFYGCCKNAQISIISFIFQMQVVQEYERVVIFRLGRLLSGGARGPGIFFIVPCVDSYQKVDMRTLTFDVPPQEVKLHFASVYHGSITSTFVPYFCSFQEQLFRQWNFATFLAYGVEYKAQKFSAEISSWHSNWRSLRPKLISETEWDLLRQTQTHLRFSSICW